VPLFKGLSPEVISALSLRCKPMVITQGNVIIAEGEPGKEMYMLMHGEVEVSEKRKTGNPNDPVCTIQL
jgi:CRP-like cAMP-binding protein